MPPSILDPCEAKSKAQGTVCLTRVHANPITEEVLPSGNETNDFPSSCLSDVILRRSFGC